MILLFIYMYINVYKYINKFKRNTIKIRRNVFIFKVHFFGDGLCFPYHQQDLKIFLQIYEKQRDEGKVHTSL